MILNYINLFNMETTKGYLYIDLKTAQEYFKKGGLHKEIALKSGYTEAELNPVLS